ncbi:hypothetical protein L228DRAFT_250325 [Xylona heveae TC161]|uniref:Uncharacterized protein n=1 Tax=Xylona heveae (strain CBS 132557 / TC161) TaxID=1328760 RepID=A0A165A3Q0_XYLHT|nr:hypothetical protein L228DRAFT_250325 [Xylona heveae TC161]KZF19906.1 hypothetical protein L228DRAFT_250325 [Xylona heveae TC161]
MAYEYLVVEPVICPSINLSPHPPSTPTPGLYGPKVLCSSLVAPRPTAPRTPTCAAPPDPTHIR